MGSLRKARKMASDDDTMLIDVNPVMEGQSIHGFAGKPYYQIGHYLRNGIVCELCRNDFMLPDWPVFGDSRHGFTDVYGI